RALLEQATRRYIAAQSAGEPRYLQRLAPDLDAVVYIENGNSSTPLRGGILSQPLKIDHTRAQHDPVSCAAYVELIVTDSRHPYELGTQLWLDAATGRISKVDTLVTDALDWLFSARHSLHYALLEDWGPILPEGKRDTRAVIKAAADAYLDLFNDTSVKVPWGEGCRRLEGGLYTQPGNTCASGVPQGIPLVNRRYVIDEEYGTVDVFLNFGQNGLQDSHEFRVEEGKIRFIHTITVCPTPNCGFGEPPDILKQDPGW
ncbi:hypothetical protein MAPG_03675, partial [Magnaporthiopsis poae ATCC 64411]